MLDAVTDRLATTPRKRVGVAPNEIAHILANERRCLVIEHLPAHAPVELSDLADSIAAAQYGPNFNGAERKRVYITLYQTHADTLVDAGVIETDHNEWAVGPNHGVFAAALDALRNRSEAER